MQDMRNALLPIEYETIEAKKQTIAEYASPINNFIRGLKERKATVYSAIMTETISGFNGVVTLSSLLLQVNLYCRKNNSLLLLKQIKADELTEAILSFYTGEYKSMVTYSKFIKELFSCLQ